MFQIATWNVNSIKVRLPQVIDWLSTSQVDVLALQEIKCIEEHFPYEALQALGYEISVSGQKTYNGVALLSRLPQHEVQAGIESYNDPQKRILMATINDIRVINLYVPNGSEVGSEKYAYKLDWLAQISAYLRDALVRYQKLVVLGDFNIAPADIDVHDPSKWQDAVLVSEAERQAYQDLLDMGFVDSFRACHPEQQAFSWWDYRRFAFKRNAGLRIDHILVSPALAADCRTSEIDIQPRQWERPSDHAPVISAFD